MIKTIIFDLDDTLYNEKTFVFGAFKEICQILCYKYSLDLDEIYNKTIEIFNKYGRGKIFNILCDELNINENIKELVEIYRNAKPKIYLYDDSKEILGFCKENNINTGLITDGKSYVQWNKIKLLNLDNVIDKIVVSDDFGKEYWKPHERTYIEIMSYFNSKPEECIYIGDNPNKDFIGAKKLGLKTIRIIREEGDHINTFLDEQFEADYKIGGLIEVKEILKDINV